MQGLEDLAPGAVIGCSDGVGEGAEQVVELFGVGDGCGHGGPLVVAVGLW